jgi:hypothetical protein
MPHFWKAYDPPGPHRSAVVRQKKSQGHIYITSGPGNGQRVKKMEVEKEMAGWQLSLPLLFSKIPMN